MMTTRLANVLRFADIKDLHDLAYCEEHWVKHLSGMGKISWKELRKLMEAENIRFLDPCNPLIQRVGMWYGGVFIFYVRLSAMDEDPSFIREGRTMVLEE
jgi:hypothetical protein